MTSSIPGAAADDVADTHPPNHDQPAIDTDENKPGLLGLPPELSDAIFQEYFQNTVLVYRSDGQHASLKPARGCSSEALAILRVCKQLYHRAKPLLQSHAAIIVHAAQGALGRDTPVRGSPFRHYTRRFRSLHAHGIGDGPLSGPSPARSLIYWNNAYLLRDLLHMWPNTQLVMACLRSKFTFHSTIITALRQHGIGQNVTFQIRFRIHVPVWCEREGKVVEREICHGNLNPETGQVKYHEAMRFPSQRLPQLAMAALVDPGLLPDASPARPLPSDKRTLSFREIWVALRQSSAW